MFLKGKKSTEGNHLGKEKGNPVDIHANSEGFFRVACYNGHLNIVKYLIKLGEKERNPIDIHVWNDYAFRDAIKHKELLEYLEYLREKGY